MLHNEPTIGKDVRITTLEFFKCFQSVRADITIGLREFILTALRNLAKNSHGDAVWVSNRKGKEVWREKFHFKKEKKFKNPDEQKKPTSGAYPEHKDQGNEYVIDPADKDKIDELQKRNKKK